MGRPANPPKTLLGSEIRAERARRGSGQVVAAEEIGIPRATLAVAERGSHPPSLDTAVALARWLGWTVERVIEAARTPVG